jgi:endoglucanase
MNFKEILLEFSARGGVSGFERENADYVKGLLKPYCDESYADAFGNVIGLKKCGAPNAKRLMLEAHVDGIGAVATDVDERGFVSFLPVGGIDLKILPALEVEIGGFAEKVYGVIGAKPPHLLNKAESGQAYTLEDLAVDTGFSKEALSEKIRAGDPIRFLAPPSALLGERLTGGLLDNRAGFVSLLICLEALKDVRLSCDIAVLAAAQEEVGLRGATVGSYRVAPDAAFVVDVGFGEAPGVSGDNVFPLGSGPAIELGPNIHPYLSKLAKDTAKEKNIPHSLEVSGGDTGTDAWAIQVSRSGVPALMLSIPLRYMHTAVETLDFEDVRNTGLLLAEMIRALDWEALTCSV